MVWPEDDLDTYGACQAVLLPPRDTAFYNYTTIMATVPTTYELDNDKLWFRERWLRTTVTGDLAGAVHDPEHQHHHHHQHEDDKTHIHHDHPPTYCTAPVLMADHAPSTLTPDSDPRSNSNDFDIDENNYEDDEYDDGFLEDDDDLPSRAATPEPHMIFSMDDIHLYTRMQAHLTTLEDCLEVSPDRDSFYANITPYLHCFYSNLTFLNRGGSAASVKLMCVARMPGADDLVDQARRVGEKLRLLRQQSGDFPDDWIVGVPLPVLGPGVLAEGRKVVSMFELFDEYVLPFFTLE